MKIQKRIARKFAFPVAMAFGVDKLLRGQASSSILNIMYHGVVTSDSTYFSARHITEEQFERHLKYYKNNFEIISVSEAFEKISSNEKLDKKYITISFDDGFKNNLTTALPLLEQYNIPTTFFISSICTDPTASKYLWSETIAALKYFYKDEPIKIQAHTFINLVDQQTETYLPNYIKALSYEKRDEILEMIENKYDLKTKIMSLPEEVWKLLNKEELIKLSQSKIVTIGSHGHRHFNLGEISPDAAREELIKSKEILEATIRKKITSIAYPDGSYNKMVKNIAESIGYKYQLAVNYKTSDDENDTRIMNRHGISSTTTYESNMLFFNKAFKNKAVKVK